MVYLAIWFTINPGDLRNPIVLRVAGVYICPQLSRAELDKLRRIHAIGNPTIVAQYFHFVLDSFFQEAPLHRFWRSWNLG